ncbi:LysR family transcriptional regulator [Vibrio zhugei]|uniref:LysR family transcriptional regulator n=1 Tax=Vibrio zhugei TaxID=2479546 RepID=A0ABV7CBZ2_9VIBR|nr:LysR family transcriptional regulator [Vibrio zhugei]
MFNNIKRIHTFITVVNSGSFTKAADQLFMSKAMVSIHIKSLEDSLNVPLLIRNSRGFIMTEAGELLYNDFQSIFSDIHASLGNVFAKHHSLSGHLRVSSTVEFGEACLIPLIGEFCHIHPELNISFHADSSLNKLVNENIDLAVRLGTLEDSTLKSRKLGCFSIMLVCSAKWLAQNPLSSLEEIQTAPWIANSNLKNANHWTLHHSDGQTFPFKFSPKFRANSSTAIRSMVQAGLGMAILPEWLIKEQLQSGEFVEVFQDWRLPKQDINVVFTGDHRVRRHCRALIDYLVEHTHF